MAPPTGPRPRRRPAAWVAGAPVTLALVAVELALFAWLELHGGSTDPAALVRAGALERSRVWAGQPWRLVTAPFLHLGPLHLAMNVAFGLAAGRIVEPALGHLRYAGVYLASAVGGSALSLLGQDGISAGASGALFGIAGALLALHLRALGGWRPFLRSPATRWLAGGIVLSTAIAPALVPLDHLAHAGGFATGAAATWLATRPRPRRLAPALAAGAALAALALAAAWPRAALTRYEAAELERRVHAALGAGDAAGARRLVEELERRGDESERLTVYRALLHVQEGALEPALRSARPLLASTDAAVRSEAVRIVSGVAKTLAYRHYTGDGAEWNPFRALEYMREACAAGDAESCRNADRVTGRVPP